MTEQTRDTAQRRVPADYPDLGLATECDGFRPFLALGDEERTIVACQRRPGEHIGMDADCNCCDCAAHQGPGWTSLRWNRHTPGALDAMPVIPAPESSDGHDES